MSEKSSITSEDEKWVTWRYFALVCVIGGLSLVTAVGVQANNIGRLSTAEAKIQALETVPAKIDIILKTVSRIEAIQEMELRGK